MEPKKVISFNDWAKETADNPDKLIKLMEKSWSFAAAKVQQNAMLAARILEKSFEASGTKTTSENPQVHKTIETLEKVSDYAKKIAQNPHVVLSEYEGDYSPSITWEMIREILDA